jgi:uncharacterized membrane protein
MKDAYDLELKISHFLRKGVFVSLFFLVVGWVGQIFLHSNSLEPFQNYSPLTLMENLNLAISQRNYFLLTSYSGLFVLISLPVIRVFLTAILFLKQGERALSVIAFLVLLTLIVSFSLGIEL